MAAPVGGRLNRTTSGWQRRRLVVPASAGFFPLKAELRTSAAVAAACAILLGGRVLCSRLAAGDDAPRAVSSADAVPDETQAELMWVNAACYVCHTTFVHEELSKIHLEEKTTCIDCHGLSAAHANDENIGATKPDITYPRHQIDASCGKCHEGHKAPARDVIARWLQRRPPSPPVCTDCHGTHRIAEADKKAKEPAR